MAATLLVGGSRPHRCVCAPHAKHALHTHSTCLCVCAVLFAEFLWDLERYMDEPEEEAFFMTLADIDRWWMDQVENRAIMLWRGEQVDGQLFEWYRDDEGFKVYSEIFGMATAVMAGYRYLTSLKSTPRQLRTRMHERLFRASCEYL